MHRFTISLIVAAALFAQAKSPFIGRWDFNITTPAGTRAAWLGITEKNGALDVWYQPTGGNVFQVKDFKAEASHLVLNLTPAQGNRPAMSWELDAAGDKL